MAKIYLSFKIIVIGLLLSLADNSNACPYIIKLYDSYGDGWNGGYINIAVNGVTIATNITLANGTGPYEYTLNLAHGDVVSTVYVPGSWAYENYYEVYDHYNQFVVRDGCTDGTCQPQGGYLFTAVCPAKDVGMEHLLSPITDCSLSSSEPVTIVFRNYGIQVLDTFYVSWSANGGSTFSSDTIFQTLLPGDSMVFTFVQTANMAIAGDYDFILTVTTPGDQYTGNDTLQVLIRSLMLLGTFPYLQDFESGNGGWFQGGTNSSWALGVPDGPVIDSAASDSTAWVTNLTGPYNNNEASWVMSPCFDFTGLTNVVFEMKVWYETYTWEDGAAVQYTTDGTNWTTLGTVNDPDNWYNNSWINGLMNGFGSSEGWHGNSGGWITVRHFLPPALAGNPHVRFRVIFGSTQYHYGNYDGVAFDDVHIYQPPPMTVASVDAYQASTDVVGKGTLNREILFMSIETLSSTNPLLVSDIRFNTTGTTNSNDIAMARVFYTNDLMGWSQYGQDVQPLSPFGFQDSLFLVEGDNYLVLVYDVAVNATTGNYLDAVIDSILIGGVWYVPTNNNPAGNRQILPAMNGTYVVNQLGGADYTSLVDAAYDLEMRGVNGPVIIDMVPGVYNEKVTFKTVFGASPVNTITIKSTTNDSTDVTIQDSSMYENENWVLHFQNTSHFIVKHIHVKPLGTEYGRAIYLEGETDNMKFLNNYLEGNANVQYVDDWLAIFYGQDRTDELVIQNNLLTNGSYGIVLFSWGMSPSDMTNISNNHLVNQYGYGIQIEYQDRPVIHKNLIESGLNYNYYYGISAYDLMDTFRITSNTIHLNTSGRGMYLSWCVGDTSYPGLVANNFVTGESVSLNYDLMGIYVNSVTNTSIVFNSVNIYGLNASGTYSLYLSGTQSNVGIYNNVLSNRTGNGLIVNINDLTGISSDYNHFYKTTGGFGRYAGITTSDLASWQAGTGLDVTSGFGDPFFYTNTNLHSFSPMLNGHAIPVTGIMYDIDGDLRHALTPDIGADEFDLPSQEASLEGFLSPLGGCGLGNENVSVRIANNGTAVISGGLTAYYQVQGGALISQAVPGTIQPGDTITFTFSTQANLSAIAADTTFEFTGFIHLTGDPVPYNDTGYTTAWSGYVPPAPVPNHTTINYGNSAVLSASGSGFKKWYLTPWDTLDIHSGDTLITGPLYDTTSYYVESYATLPGSGGGNLALNAQASHSGGGSGSYGPGNYNDNFIPAYGYTPWGWVTTNGWIEYTWPDPVAFSSVKFYKDDRPMSSCIFQYWDGSSFVDFYYYNSSTINDSVSFPLVTTTQLRFYNIAGNSNPNFREIQVFGPAFTGCPSNRVAVFAYVTAYPAIDAGITAIVQPSGPVPEGTTQDLKVMLRNYGLNTLQNVTIAWKLNNVLQTPFPWTGSLPHGDSTLVTIASPTFQPGDNCIKVWTHAPNGMPDNFNLNDTSYQCFKGCLSGTYTIGPATSGTFDFNTFTAAVNALANSGICNPVIFDVYPGTYTEQVVIPAIPGADTNNTITFRGVNHDSTEVILQYAATSSGTNYVVKFNMGSYFIFRHITMKATGTSYGCVVEFADAAHYNTITNCVISTHLTSTSSNFIGIYSSTYLPSNHVTISNNVIEGGYYSIYWYGSSTYTKTDFTVKGNILRDFYYSGIYCYYTNEVYFESNQIINRNGSSTLYPIYLSYSYSSGIISKNQIISNNSGTYYGVYLYYCHGNALNPFLISNNFISQEGNPTGTVYGIYSYNSIHNHFYHNSISIFGGSATSGRAFYLSSGNSNRIVNNIFSNFNSGYAYYINSTSSVVTSDYNDYYTTGMNLAYWGMTHQTLASLQSYNFKDQNSLNIQPPFTSLHNLALTNTFLSGKATPLASVPDDIFGHPRTATPTIGAHEIPLIPNDAGVLAFILPDGLTTYTEFDPVPVQVVLMNFGTNTLYTIPVSYQVNQTAPVSAVYNGILPPLGTDTMSMPSFITPAGNSTLCAYTTLAGDSNTFNDTTCINHYAQSNIDGELVHILPFAEGCGLGSDTVSIAIANVAIAMIPGGFTASYQRQGLSVVTETINTAIQPGDTLIYSFNALVDLSAPVDTTWQLTSWISIPNDNQAQNDSAVSGILSLAIPSLPTPTSPVTISFGSSAVLDANTILYTEWFADATSITPLASGSIFQTPLLYDTTVYYVAQYFGMPQQHFIIGTGTTQNSSTSYPTPYGNWYWGNKEQYLVRASELFAAGLQSGDIDGLAFNVISPNGVGMQNFTIQMGHTTQTEMTGNFISTGLTTVYTTPVYADVAGWNDHPFQTPFQWDGTSNIVIDVCFNNSSYTANAVVSLAQPGFNATVQTHGDVSGICNYTSGSVYNLRPVIRLTGNAIGCSSLRAPIVVNVINIPPLGKPKVNPLSMLVPVNGCNNTETRNIVVKNIGNAALQYTTFGGPHDIDTTSTKYYNSSTYPDTTTHVLNTIPPSIDSLFLEITLNGAYSAANAYATLIIEGVNLGIIPDGNIANGQDITVAYAFGGAQLSNWVQDGELYVRIGNSALVYPWYGTRMHKVRAYTKPATWISMSETTGSITVGDSLSIPVQFAATGLTAGTYYASIPLAFNHPGYPFVKIPVYMILTGSPDIYSDPCLVFTPIFQYNTITDSVMLYNLGCDTLIISNILNSDTTFTPHYLQAVIPPFDSLWLQVDFSPLAQQTYLDTLVVKSNDNDHFICLNGVGLSPPVIILSTDSLDAVITGCDDTLLIPITISNAGNAPLIWQAISGMSIADHFDSGLNTNLWQSTTGILSGSCGSYSAPNALYFNSSGTREAITQPLNLLGGGDMEFYLKIGNGSSPCETADYGEDIKLQYSINGGATWQDINTYYTGSYNSFTQIIETVPNPAKTASTLLRWWQPSHSGSGYDNWSIDNVSVSNAMHFVEIIPDTGTVAPLGQQAVQLKLDAHNLLSGQYSGNIVFLSNDPLTPVKMLPLSIELIGAPDLNIQPITCLDMDSTMKGGISSKTFMVYNDGCDTLKVTSLTTSTPHFSSTTPDLLINPFENVQVTVLFHPQTTGLLYDTVTLISNDGIHHLCLTGVGIPAPEMVLSHHSLTANILNCNDSMIIPVTITNPGQVDLHWNIANITGASSTVGSSMGLKVGVYNSNVITNLLNTTQDIEATSINTMDFNTISQYDVIMNIRGGNINQNDVLAYIQAGGSWIGEWSSNDHPFTWGAVSGNIPYSGNSGTYGVNILDPNHYLATHINWAAMPYGANPVDYMRDLRNLNDPQAKVIATANHYSYPNNPLLVEKDYGSGKIIIFNWDYDDDPDYNGIVSNAIFEVVRYAGMKAKWLTASPDQDTVPPSGFTTINVKFNALGLNSGTYTGKILIHSNDPVLPGDSILCTMIVTGAPDFRMSYPVGCIDFDTLIQGFSATDTIHIFNDGCDTLDIVSITNSLAQYILSDTSITLMPGDSAQLTITFVPDAAQVFDDTIQFVTNDGNHELCITGVGIDAPIISYSPASLSHSFQNCIDSVTLPLTIYNTGIGDLRYNIANLFGSSFDQTSTQYYTTYGATTQHHFPNMPVTCDSLKVILTINGDFDEASENCSWFIEGVNMGIVQDNNLANGTDIVNSFTFTGSQMLSWLSDGELNISVVNSSYVDHWSGLVSMHKVQVIISGVPWISVDKDTDTVVTGDSSVVMVTMKTAGLNNGIYNTSLRILSNDPVNQQINIPCSLTINGTAAISFSDPCLHFGTVMQYAMKKDTLTITNTGCHTLIINSIYSTLSHFLLSSSYLTIPPGSSANLIVTFMPSAVGQFSDNVYFSTNIGSYTVCLTGTGADASILNVLPASFNKTISVCNDTITDILQVQNLGTGNLTYQVFGGRGLSGDSTVLVIRDAHPWSVNIEQYLQNQFGVIPDVITSSQVAAANFGIYDVIIVAGGQSTSFYTALSAQNVKFTNYLTSGGIVLYMLANYSVNTFTLPGSVNMVYGNPENQNLIVDASHPIVQGLTNPLNGSNANSNYLTNLPANAKVITQTNVTAVPTTAEYEVGSGLVIATGMLWEYHSTMPSYNISTMMHNALSYALGTIGTSPSWLSFAYTSDTLFGISSTTVTVKFNSTGTPNGTYHSNIIVYSNDPVSPQMLVPCTLAVNGSAHLITSANCLLFGTVIQGATEYRTLTLYNTGCADLNVLSVQSQSSEYVAVPLTGVVPAGDSLAIEVGFTPTATGQRNSTLNILTNLGTTQICLEGFSINPPVINVAPASYNITINDCNDTVSQLLKLYNTGLGDAVYHILGLYGTDIDKTSNIPFITAGALTTHTFTNLPPNIDTLLLEVTLSGDFDQALEFATLVIEGTTISQLNDGNLTAGTPYTNYYGFGGSQLSNWLSDGQLTVTIQNNPTVDHWTGLNSYHQVRLRVNGNHWIHVAPLTDTISSNDSTILGIDFFSTNMSAGTHLFNLLIGSNDPGNAQVSIPCTLTVNGDPDMVVGQTCLHFDSTMIGATDVQNLTIANTGCDTLKITQISSTLGTVTPAVSVLDILPDDTITIPVTFTPVLPGSLTGSLVINSNAGQATLCLTATGIPAPSIQVNQVNFISNLACVISETKSMIIHNTGQAPLTYQLNPTAGPFLAITNTSGTIQPGDSSILFFTFDKTGLPLGTHTAAFTLQCNDPLNQMIAVTCTLYIPNMLVPVNLGPDIAVCANQQVILDAGSGYSSYLWDDNTTDSIRQVFASGTYYVTVVDSNACPSSDTINVTFYSLPLVDAGADTSICDGEPFERAGIISGTIQNNKVVQIGTSTSFTGNSAITPFTTAYTAIRRQIIIQKNEMEQKGFKRGIIETLAFNLGSVGNPAVLNDFNISIGTTTATSLVAGFVENLTNVYSNASQTLQMGWYEFTLLTPYFYDGMDNIVIEICFSNSTYNYNSSVQYHNAQFSSASRYAYTYNASQNGCNLTGGHSSVYRPNIRIGGTVDEGLYTWTGPGNFVSNEPVLRINAVASQNVGFYHLTVDNGIGCTSSDVFNLSMLPLPIVNAGSDTFVFEGGYYQMQAAVSGGVPPYSYAWSPAATLNDSTLLQPVALPVVTTTYTLKATGSNGCSASDQMKITVIPRYNISGVLTYNNAAYTPLTNSRVYLSDNSNTILDSLMTDAGGAFTFYLRPPGVYRLAASVPKPWGGVNATDALVVQRHVINLNPLSGLRLTGADVNNSQTVSSVDALLILRRTLGMDTSFIIGDWVIENPVITITDNDVQKSFQGLASGDVNGSYQPPFLRQHSLVEICQDGYVVPEEGFVEIPLRAGQWANLGALTLVLDAPTDGVILEAVTSPLDGLMYNIHDGKLRIGWSDEQGYLLSPGDVLLTLKLGFGQQLPESFWLRSGPESEMADVYANVLDPMILTAPRLSDPENENGLKTWNVPNPFRERTTIFCIVPCEGDVEMEVFDMYGRSITLFRREGLSQGEHSFDISAQNLSAGIYHYRITLDARKKMYRATNSMIITR